MKRLLVISSVLFFLIACENKNGNNTAAAPGYADSSKAEKTESKEDRNKKIVKEAMAALNDHNIEKMVGLMSDDVVDYADGTGSRTVKGKDSVRASMTAFFNSFPDFKGNELKYFADGDHVVVLGEYSGTFKKDMGKVKATNKSFKFPDADVFTLTDDGKISSHRYIQPDATLFSQVGAKH